jgi:hypothetical protein
MNISQAAESMGCVVAYLPEHASLESGIDIGVIGGLSERNVFVQFKGDPEGTLKAVAPTDLVFYDRPLSNQIIQNRFNRR